MKLNHRQYSNEGPPLLVLHGLLGNLGNWGWQSRELARDFAVAGLDLRNHGDSPHADEMDYPAMAGDVLEFMDDQGLTRAHLLGHSMGGKVAMQLALMAPDRVERLAVADIAPVEYPPEREASTSDKSVSNDAILQALAALKPEGLKSRSEADEILAGSIRQKAIRQFLLTNLHRAKGGGYCWRINLEALESNYGALRAAPAGTRPFEGEVLFIKGELSAYIQEKHREEILSRFPRAQVRVIAGAGHWLHAEKPQSFYRVAHDFFTGKD